MKIFLMTDLEGVSGVLDSENCCCGTGQYYQSCRRLLTEEVNAAIRGFFNGGATEVEVQIGHHTDSIVPELLDERAALFNGRHDPLWPWGLDQSFDALAFVGQHAKAGTSYSHLAHTGNKRTLDQRVNGISIGEYGTLALCAMELGIPTIFAAGEEALCREAEALTPGVVTVAGKRGVLPDRGESRDFTFAEYKQANLSARHEPIAKVRKMLEENAEKAMRRRIAAPESFHYPDIKPPYYMVREYRRDPEDRDFPDAFALAGYADRFIDGCNNIYYAAYSTGIPLETVLM